MSNHLPAIPQDVAQQKTVPVNGTALTAAAQAAEAVELSLWQRYSPHHEFPLSVLTTFVMYFFAVLVVLVLGGLVLNLWAAGSPMPIEVIAFPGGGGDPDGKKESHVNHGPQDPLNFTLSDEQNNEPVIAERADLSAPDSRDRLAAQVKGKPFVSDNSLGRGGRGIDGGKGDGVGPGDGDGTGPGKLTMREQRKDRWIVNFPFNSGEDYLRQLGDLGAYLAFPEPDQKFRIYEDLGTRTPTSRLGTVADFKKWNRIYWRDSNLGSRDAIAYALNMSSQPPYFWIFLPVELEKELFAKELAFRGLSEEAVIKQNLETTFSVERIGSKFSVKVLKQERKGAGR